MAQQVIVVGGGLAGLSAAHTVLEHGGRVVLLDKNSFLGGNSTKATSGINGALTRTQVQKGIQDSPLKFEEDTAISFAGGKKGQPVDPLVKVLTHNSGPAVEWLIERFGLDLSLVSQLGGHSFPRTHRGGERFPGMTITYALMEKLEEIAKTDAARIETGARVSRLISSPDGEVVGCEYEKDGQTFKEDGPVIIATGGFAADFTENSLLKQVRPDLLHLPTTNGDHCTGDGIKLAQELGGATIDLEHVQVHPTGLVHPEEPDAKVKFLAAEALRGVGGILLNARGERFVNELGRRDYVTGEMWKSQGPFRLVLNGAASKEIEWHCKHYCGRGLMRKFDNGAAIAKDMGVSEQVLADTFAKYNQAAKAGKDEYGKLYYHNVPFEMNDHFHVAFVTPVIHYCMGGLKITPEAELIKDGGVIPGLFAAGEVAGGIHGVNRLGGNSLLDCVVFGRVAGGTAAKHLMQTLITRGPSDRIATLANHFGGNGNAVTTTINNGGSQTQIDVEPHNNKVSVQISWNGQQQQGASRPAVAASSPAASAKPAVKSTSSGAITTPVPAQASGGGAVSAAPAANPGPKLTMAEVAKHNTEKDCWVVVNGKVLDVTGFLKDHPGGKKAIMLFAGKDATEEFNMLHKPDVVQKYAPNTILGDLVEGDGEEDAAAPTPVPAAEAAPAAAGGPSLSEPSIQTPAMGGDLSKFDKPDNPCSLAPMKKAVPSNQQSAVSGGTADFLPAERSKVSFDVEELTNLLDGGPEKTKRRRFILSPTEGTDASFKYYSTRPEIFREHVKHFIQTHEDFWGKITPTREEVAWMMEYSMNSGSLMNHYGLFLPTILGQANDEQMGWWALRTLTCSIIGCYAQTELGHGSNVRGLQTVATYDKSTQEFVLNTPTLQSMKWWPGALGKTGTHALVYAQLILDGKEYGVHIFMLQIRDSNHRPIAGIEVGDVGPKMGDAANDTGFMRLENVRVPREHMLAKYQEVTPDGQYVKSDKATNDKLHYATMMFTRGIMVRSSGGQLARAVTIATRYSLVRRQGFKNTKDKSHKAEERQIIDYAIQRYRIFRQLALTYALKFTGRWMIEKFKEIEGDTASIIQDTAALPEIAATSAGLKGLCTFLAAQGMEDCRKCCGGNGYLLNSGIAQLSMDYLWQTTAEGDYVVMILQTARFLIKTLNQARKGEKLGGPCAYLAPAASANFNLEKCRPRRGKSTQDYHNVDYLCELFSYRALISVVGAAEDLEKRLKAGEPYDEAWNHTGLELFEAVKWHCLSFMLHNYNATLKEINTSPAILKSLTTVAALFGCSNILDGQWAGVISTQELSMVQTAVSQLMEVMRPDVIGLVDAFDIPDRVLNSTIGRFDGNIYEALYEGAKRSQLNQTDPFLGFEEHLKPHLDESCIEHLNQPMSKL